MKPAGGVAARERELQPTQCAICGTAGDAVELYPANLRTTSYSPDRFVSRERSDRAHHRIVRCIHCGLVRSDPVADPRLLEMLYAQSFSGYERLEPWRKTYGRYLRRLGELAAVNGDLLEVGCGSGFFLEEALAQGYRSVRGVEPSAATVEHASRAVRGSIVVDVMRPGLFAPESFDVICLFQVLDHLTEPVAVLRECLRLLRPGGLILCLNHNVEALSARVLGERSPIFDVQHTYLYSPRTMRMLLERSGFTVITVGRASNDYDLEYLADLATLAARPKRLLLSALRRTRLGRLRVRLPIGNLFLVAQRPAS